MERDVDNLLNAYFSGDSSPAVVDAVDCWVREDPKVNSRVLAEFGLIDQLLANEQKLLDASAIYSVLLELDEEERRREVEKQRELAEAELERERKAQERSVKRAREAAATQQSPGLFGSPMFYLGTAVALLIAVVIMLPKGDWTPGGGPVPSVNYVSKLTGQENARWSDGSVAVGDELQAGQKLSLTSGFAEITTSRGAVAKLQAPASIEIPNDPNAIRLHSGLLLGIVEIASAEGFVVQTPNMKLTDLGTRFGVFVGDDNATELLVVEGKVEAVRSDAPADTKAVVLVAGESVRAAAGVDAITIVEPSPERFAELMPELRSQVISLPGTGYQTAFGQNDPNWEIVAVDGKPLASPRAIAVGGGVSQLKTHANDPNSSQWLIWIPPGAEQAKDECVYLVRTTVDMPKEIDSPGAHVALKYMADNELRAIHINGNRVELPRVDIRDMFTKFHEASVSEHWIAGQNTVEAELVNIRINGKRSLDAGMRLGWDLVVPAITTAEEAQ